VRVVAALGGNALLERGERPTAEAQQARVERAAAALADVARAHDLAVTHGNGPQVGLLALQSEALPDVPGLPLDLLGAETEGLIGHQLELALRNAVPEREVATLLTQTEVAEDDPAFAQPTKPVGPVYAEDEARRLAAARGWSVAPDGGGLRRVVPSPAPRRILEQAAVERLLGAGMLVICAGGGGIPVVRRPGGGHRGVEAVVDKDLVAAWLARALGADALLLLTDVPAVYRDWPGRREPFGAVAPATLRGRRFAPGSMAPKVEAACAFVEGGGRLAAIGALGDAAALLAGEAGTRVRAGAEHAAPARPDGRREA
jgi:carbamate kinase